MKFLAILVSAIAVSAAAVEPRKKGKAAVSATTAAAAASTAAASGSTLVLKEVGGVAGNECLTFRNNGEIVDAACVNTSADRQMTPGTSSGASVLKVQRAFTADFRSDLVSAAACVGFNGTHFKAEPCADTTIEPVTFNAQGELVATGGACASGHDSAAQMTVDTTGKKCATYTSTNVTPATS